MLQAVGVTKRYGKLVANEGVSLEVQAGQIAVLLGPNGAGKSTLIKCVAGLLRFEGEILIGGYGNKTLAAKALLGYVPEMPAVYELLTVAEHLDFIRRAYRMEDDGYGQALMERLEMADKRDKLGRELSKGMQQKLSILCALVHRPKLVIFDEPLVGLDPHGIKELKLIFQELRDAGTAVLISTHMLESVEDFWDVAHILMHGRFAATMSGAEADKQSLSELFFEITEGRA